MLGLRVRLCLSEMDYAGSGCAHLSLCLGGKKAEEVWQSMV